MSSLMANGYIHSLVDDNLDFETFMLRSARCFMPLITMRDEPHDAPIPDKFEESYCATNHREAVEEYNTLKSMTEEEKLSFGQKQKEEEIARCEKYISETLSEIKIVEEMKAKVLSWVPPTPDHVNVKTTVLGWMNEAINRNTVDYYEKDLLSAKNKSAIELYNTSLREASRSVEYYAKDMQEEQDRNEFCTKWIQKYKDSLKMEQNV